MDGLRWLFEYLPVIFPVYFIALDHAFEGYVREKVRETFGNHAVLGPYHKVIADVAHDWSIRVNCLVTFLGSIIALMVFSAGKRVPYLLVGILVLLMIQFPLLLIVFGKSVGELVDRHGLFGWRYATWVNLFLLVVNGVVALFIWLHS